MTKHMGLTVIKKQRHEYVADRELREFAKAEQKKNPNSLTSEFTKYATLAGCDVLVRWERGRQ